LDSSRRTQHLISEVLELLRELSYEAQRQDKTIDQLEARVAALEKEAEDAPLRPERGTVHER
jgi:uncharacterized coiled-coil DUF342 family protein